jgi:hypothetical protein
VTHVESPRPHNTLLLHRFWHVMHSHFTDIIGIYRAFLNVLQDYQKKWPPRSPDITPCDFFRWGYVKDRVFFPSLSRDLADLKARTIAAVKNIDTPMLTRVWQELEYRIDVCPPCHPWCTHRTSLVVKKNFFSFAVAMNNSIKVGPLVFLLQMFVITENVMKHLVF